MHTADTVQIATSDILAPESLRDPKVREGMSSAAVRLFLKLADHWNLSVDQRLALLGDISRQTYHNWQRGKVGTLSRDQLERISLLLGTHKGLKLLFADEAAGLRWFKSSNLDLPFGGAAPLDRALRGGIDDLYAVRRYIDAWRGIK
jgi:Protein of unknown function (DUF2384)